MYDEMINTFSRAIDRPRGRGISNCITMARLAAWEAFFFSRKKGPQVF